MPGTIDLRAQPRPICDACRREVDRVRTSLWHGADRLCLECFFEWYDPTNDTFNPCDPVQLGNCIRRKHNLPPLEG